MDLPELIDALSRPSAYPHPVDEVTVIQTHISVVFLAGRFVYKIKKPVNLGFLDFTTLQRRHQFCENEVRLNRRQSKDIYLDIVPVCDGPNVHVEGEGDVVEWAVKMKRLPEDATLESRLLAGTLDDPLVRAVARKIAAFHDVAASNAEIAAFGAWDVIARNVRENFEQAAPSIGTTLSRAVWNRLRSLSEAALARLEPLISDRARRGMTRDTHGDLHLDHVYFFPDLPPDESLAIIDCIEFNDRFRYADPIADMAFLVMDLRFHGRRDLADTFVEEYFQASGDTTGRELLPLYVSYRAAVRGKVEGFALSESEIPETERTAALSRARGHWLLALDQLETPDRRPCLILVGGLPGTGKSTLARRLAEGAGFRLIRSDVVRKELAGLPVDEPARTDVKEGIYTPEWTDRTYAECLRRAETSLFEGERVVVDANFGAAARRAAFVEAADRWCVPVRFLECVAPPETARHRIEGRRNDASDADWAIYQNAVGKWEATTDADRAVKIPTDGTIEQAADTAMQAVREVCG